MSSSVAGRQRLMCDISASVATKQHGCVTRLLRLLEDNDGFVTLDEYVENRIITDEAKKIFNEMDTNQNGILTVLEVLKTGKIKDNQLAKEIFSALDTNNNKELIIPEYLRVWGKWARNVTLQVQAAK